MADWTDPTTWRDVGKLSASLNDLTRHIAQARKAGDGHASLELAGALADILQGQQKALVEVSFVAGKLAAYTTAAHAERLKEIDSLRDLIKSTRRLDKAVAKLTRRLDKLEARLAKK